MTDLNECNILIYADDSYVKHAGVLCMSIALNASEKNIYNIFFGYTGKESESSLPMIEKDLSKFSNVSIYFFEITEHLNAGIKSKSNKSYISDNIYAKLYVFQHLPSNLNKILFLDSDIIALRDVYDLYKIDVSDVLLAARGEPQTFEKYYGLESRANVLGLNNAQQYFNSGVMLVNLEKWREELVSERTIRFLKEEGRNIYLHDQDGLNSIIMGNWLELPHEWHPHPHSLNKIFTTGGFSAQLTDGELAKMKLAGLAHFLGLGKPWRPGCKSPWKNEYLYYLSKTSFRQLFQEVKKIHEKENKIDFIRKIYFRMKHLNKLITR
ncbi:glycosyltransferase family 8 protein [Neobacillus cucumis]|nr:glycosyltransferase family 8 protein [Neobacillus cucumis]